MIKIPDNGILYHGSYTEVSTIDLSICRKGLDFGQGFYLTSSYSQANKFIKSAVERARVQKLVPESYCELDGKVSIFQYKPDSSLRICYFDEANIEWLHFVASHREGMLFPEEKEKYAEFDIVCGKIANDNTAVTLNYYVAGTYGKPGDESVDRFVIERLKPNRLTDQFCFRTEQAIRALSFIRSEAYVQE